MIIIKYSLLILIKFKKRRNDNYSTKRDLLNNTQLPPVTRQKFPNVHPLHDIKDQENLKNPVQKIFIHRRSTTSYPMK